MTHARVLALVGDLDGCALWRALLPVSELQRQGFDGIEWDRMMNPVLDHIFDLRIWEHLRFDAITLPRQHFEPKDKKKAEKWFGALRNAGIAVLYELDDDLFSEDFERRLIEHKGYDKVKAKERRGCIMDTIEQCDGMTVSSQRLATMARKYVDMPIRVVPNYIDLRWFKTIQKHSQRDPHLTGTTIGWAGGMRSSWDLKMMAEAWAIIADKYSHVTFVIQGHHDPVFYELVPEERIAMIDWMPIESYPAGLLNIDIGCCPLEDTAFNRAKTYIKAMEYAASGAPVVASPPVYSQIIEHGVDGYIARSVDDWVEYLSLLVEDYTHRKEMAKRLLAKVRKEHSLENHAWRWVEAWTDLIQQFRNKQRSQILLPKGVRVNGRAHATA